MLMERAGTGGSLFRNLYRDFLKESADLISSQEITAAYRTFLETARQWKEISDLFYHAGETKDFKYINQASKLLVKLSEDERAAMAKLEKADA